MVKDELTYRIGAELKKMRKLQEAHLGYNLLGDLTKKLDCSASKINWIESGKQYLTLVEFTKYCDAVQLDKEEFQFFFGSVVDIIRKFK